MKEEKKIMEEESLGGVGLSGYFSGGVITL